MIRYVFLSLLTALTVSAISAEPLTVETPWARATVPAAQVGAVYVTLQNPSTESVRIVAASSPACRTTEIHDHVRLENGNAQMVAVPVLDIAAGATVTMQPGGKHIMLIDLVAPLVEGETVAVTLTTASGATIAITAPIKGIGALSAHEAADEIADDKTNESTDKGETACACCEVPETKATTATELKSAPVTVTPVKSVAAPACADCE